LHFFDYAGLFLALAGVISGAAWSKEKAYLNAIFQLVDQAIVARVAGLQS